MDPLYHPELEKCNDIALYSPGAFFSFIPEKNYTCYYISGMDEKFRALEKFNFWNGKVPELGFLRKEYTGNIFDYVGNKLVKVLTTYQQLYR